LHAHFAALGAYILAGTFVLLSLALTADGVSARSRYAWGVRCGGGLVAREVVVGPGSPSA